MRKSEATADVFITAFKALPKKERDKVVIHLIEEKKLRHDLIDIAIAQERLQETTRPLMDVLKEIKRPKRGK